MLVTLGTQRVNLWRTTTHKARKNQLLVHLLNGPYTLTSNHQVQNSL